MKLPCVMFDQPGLRDVLTLEWQKGEVNNGNWSLVARQVWIKQEQSTSSFSKEWDRRDINISTFTGDLTIIDFQQHDAGWYRCDMSGKKSSLVELKLFGLYCGLFNQQCVSERLQH